MLHDILIHLNVPFRLFKHYVFFLYFPLHPPVDDCIMDLPEAGMQNRRVSAHALNRESSRTHALFLGRGADVEIHGITGGGHQGAFFGF